MVDFLEKAGCEVCKGIFIPERRAGSRAGVTTFGKNNFAYTKGVGSFILVSSVVIDKELDYDEPTFIRQQEAAVATAGENYRGYKGIVIDNDLDVPTFLRRKAD